LFISFIYDVSGVIHFCLFHIYAADLQIYHSSFVADLQRCYNEDKIEPQKEQDEDGGGDVPQPELFIGPDSIEVVPKVRNLGFVLNRNLTSVDHYKEVCQRIYSVLRYVKPHARYTLFGVRKRLIVSLIMPHINSVMLFSQLLTLHHRGDLTLR
jgi:hypothetical protein